MGVCGLMPFACQENVKRCPSHTMTNCYSKAGPLENTDFQPASDPLGAPSKGAYRTWRNEAAGMDMVHMMESVGHSLLASVSCALYMSG
jgi:hypothetical protein